jgi:hypothetical protein
VGGLPTGCPICGRSSPDEAEQCDCGYRFIAAAPAKHNDLDSGGAIVDLAWIVLANTATCSVVWGIAKVALAIDQHLLMLLVVIPQVLTLQPSSVCGRCATAVEEMGWHRLTRTNSGQDLSDGRTDQNQLAHGHRYGSSSTI